MPALPPFVSRPRQPDESICTKCFLTIRITVELPTLKKAQDAHECIPLDLVAMTGRAKPK